MGQLATYPIFRAFDRDGEPLAGGKVYAYLSGTSTPHALYADAELTTPLENPVILDSSGEAEFYYDGAAYKLLLTDKDDVEQWLLDPVSGSGSTGLPGLGMGTNTVLIRPTAGSAQASAGVFPQDVLGIALTACISESFGTSQGLSAIGVGNPDLPDAWGILEALTAPTTTTAGGFLAYGGQPQPLPGAVTLTAYGGLFDGTGAVYVTGYFFQFSAPTTAGMTFLPGSAGDPIPPTPQPPASETTAGIAEVANAAEGNSTDNSRIVSPLRLKEQLDPVRADVTALEAVGATHTSQITALEAKIPAGTPLRVPRWATDGLNLESTGLSLDAASNLLLGAVVPGTGLQSGLVLPLGGRPTAAHPANAVQIWVENHDGAAGQGALKVRSASGAVTTIGTGLLARKHGFVLTTYGVGAPYALTADNTGIAVVGNNATEITYLTLPTAAYGLHYTVLNFHPSPRGTRIVAPAGATIRIVGLVSTAGGYCQSQVVGSFLTLMATGTTGWTAITASAVADWTVG
jgi:hypothetical protein